MALPLGSCLRRRQQTLDTDWSSWAGQVLARSQTHPGWVRLACALCTADPSLVMKHCRRGMAWFSVSRHISARPSRLCPSASHHLQPSPFSWVGENGVAFQMVRALEWLHTAVSVRAHCFCGVPPSRMKAESHCCDHPFLRPRLLLQPPQCSASFPRTPQPLGLPPSAGQPRKGNSRPREGHHSLTQSQKQTDHPGLKLKNTRRIITKLQIHTIK